MDGFHDFINDRINDFFLAFKFFEDGSLELLELSFYFLNFTLLAVDDG